MFETPLVPRTAPVVDEDVPWEQYRVLDPIGAAQAEAEFWAVDRGLGDVDPSRDGVDGVAGGDTGGDGEVYRPPAGTAAVAAAVADLQGPALAGFLADLPAFAGVDGATVVEAMVGYEKVIRWAQAMQLRWVAELASRREDGRTGWARDSAAKAASPAATSTAGDAAQAGAGPRARVTRVRTCWVGSVSTPPPRSRSRCRRPGGPRPTCCTPRSP